METELDAPLGDSVVDTDKQAEVRQALGDYIYFYILTAYRLKRSNTYDLLRQKVGIRFLLDRALCLKQHWVKVSKFTPFLKPDKRWPADSLLSSR